MAVCEGMGFGGRGVLGVGEVLPVVVLALREVGGVKVGGCWGCGLSRVAAGGREGSTRASEV